MASHRLAAIVEAPCILFLHSIVIKMTIRNLEEQILQIVDLF